MTEHALHDGRLIDCENCATPRILRRPKPGSVKRLSIMRVCPSLIGSSTSDEVTAAQNAAAGIRSISKESSARSSGRMALSNK